MRIESKNLIMRGFEEQDIEDAYEYLSDAETMYFIQDPMTKEEVSSFITRYGMREEPFIYALELKESRKVIGHIIFHEANFEEIYEIGLILNKNYIRKGYGYEICKELIDYSFNTLKLHKIVAETIEGNQGSISLLAKLQLKLEGTLRQHNYNDGAWVDEYNYGLLKSEYVK